MSSHNFSFLPVSFPHCFLSQKEWNEGMKRRGGREKGKEEGKEKREGEESQVESKHRVKVWHL